VDGFRAWRTPTDPVSRSIVIRPPAAEYQGRRRHQRSPPQAMLRGSAAADPQGCWRPGATGGARRPVSHAEAGPAADAVEMLGVLRHADRAHRDHPAVWQVAGGER